MGESEREPAVQIIDVHIWRLRRVLAATPFRTDTLRRQGYGLTVTSDGGG